MTSITHVGVRGLQTIAALLTMASFAQTKPAAPAPNLVYFRHVFMSLTDSRIPSQARQVFGQTYAAQFSLSQSEAQSLATAAQQFSTAAAAAKASSSPIIAAANGGSLNPAGAAGLEPNRRGPRRADIGPCIAIPGQCQAGRGSSDTTSHRRKTLEAWIESTQSGKTL
jgi:hypothetical protein